MRIRTVVAGFALLFFSAPLILWVGGVRARPFENRRMAEAPKLSQGWDAFDEATRFFVDRLPLREQAVRANTWTSLHVFSTTPDYSRSTVAGGNRKRDSLPFGEPRQPAKADATATPANQPPDTNVVQGPDGWLFLEGELVRACSRFEPWDKIMTRYVKLVDVIRASGREVVFVVPPDKSSIYSEYVPEDGFASQDCWQAGHRAAWAAIESTGEPDILPLRETLLAGKAAPPEEAYYPEDTHWNTKGATLAARALLARLDAPPLLESDIQRSRGTRVGDLTGLIGAPEGRETPVWTVRRPGLPAPEETDKPLGTGTLHTTRYPRNAVAQVPGRTVYVYDSFGFALLDAFKPYFRQLAAALWYGTPVKDTIKLIAGADTVILEKVERDINFLASDQGIVTPKFLRDLERALKRSR